MRVVRFPASQIRTLHAKNTNCFLAMMQCPVVKYRRQNQSKAKRAVLESKDANTHRHTIWKRRGKLTLSKPSKVEVSSYLWQPCELHFAPPFFCGKVGLLLFALRLSRATVELRTSLRKLLRELSFSQTLTVLCMDKHEHCSSMFWHVCVGMGGFEFARRCL